MADTSSHRQARLRLFLTGVSLLAVLSLVFTKSSIKTNLGTSSSSSSKNSSSTPLSDNSVSNSTAGKEDIRPRNVRIAFIGDSVTRYQYLALSYYLKTGQWPTDDDGLLWWSMQNTYHEFYNHSHQLLRPYETACDCYKPESEIFEVRRNNHTENRHFVDPERNNYVAFFLKFGNHPVHGHLSPVESQSVAKQRPHASPTDTYANYLWEYSTWGDLIRFHIAKLDPRPDFIVWNGGLHTNRLHEEPVQSDIFAALRETNITGVFKTTTYRMRERRGRPIKKRIRTDEVDQQLCALSQLCLDLSWTGNIVGNEHYYDNVHLKAESNKRMNIELLELLGKRT